ncbi:MAG TPA: 50S ribosomal protein L24 [Verrucomicrobiota bacterium]|nr:50S ribosomal protein L24 [Verrucomicrobiota bacterium]
MQKCHIKKGDIVVVIAGTEKGKRGKVIEVLPQKQRVLVEGVKMIKKHMRKSQLHPQGAIIEREGTIHISNVMLAEKYDARMVKHGNKPTQNVAETK